jgi:hypothetical protein
MGIIGYKPGAEFQHGGGDLNIVGWNGCSLAGQLADKDAISFCDFIRHGGRLDSRQG